MSASSREEMVQKQIVRRGIHDPSTLKSMLEVPRELFVPPLIRNHAYDDSPLPIGEGQTISQPYIVALMTSALKLKPHDIVLEIGTGSGYQAAVLSRIVQFVYTVERIPELVESAKKALEDLGYTNLEVKLDDGTLGWREKGPFDAIIVTAGAPAIPQALKEQLKVGGRLVIPVGEATEQRLVLLTRTSSDEWTEKVLEFVRFVPLIGDQGW